MLVDGVQSNARKRARGYEGSAHERTLAEQLDQPPAAASGPRSGARRPHPRNRGWRSVRRYVHMKPPRHGAAAGWKTTGGRPGGHPVFRVLREHGQAARGFVPGHLLLRPTTTPVERRDEQPHCRQPGSEGLASEPGRGDPRTFVRPEAGRPERPTARRERVAPPRWTGASSLVTAIARSARPSPFRHLFTREPCESLLGPCGSLPDRYAAKVLQLRRTAVLCGAGATGLEPATSGVTGRRSNQLSYAPRARCEE